MHSLAIIAQLLGLSVTFLTGNLITDAAIFLLKLSASIYTYT